MILDMLYGKAVHQSRIANISKQKGVKDCGLYAIAIAVLLVKGLDPEGVTFVQDQMRNHVVSCFEAGNFEDFPVVL